MEDPAALFERLQALMGELEAMDDPAKARVLELLDGVDEIHRTALARLPAVLGPEALARACSDPAVRLLLEAYGIGVDEADAAESAVESIRPYIHSHGGELEVLEASDGIVRVRLSGSCSGCSASAITLRQGVERALAENLPGFRALEVEEDAAAPRHPPPGPTLLEIENVPGSRTP